MSEQDRAAVRNGYEEERSLWTPANAAPHPCRRDEEHCLCQCENCTRAAAQTENTRGA